MEICETAARVFDRQPDTYYSANDIKAQIRQYY